MKPAYSIAEIDFQSQTIKIYAPWKAKNIKNNEMCDHQNQTADVKKQQIGIFETLNVESEIDHHHMIRKRVQQRIMKKSVILKWKSVKIGPKLFKTKNHQNQVKFPQKEVKEKIQLIYLK